MRGRALLLCGAVGAWLGGAVLLPGCGGTEELEVPVVIPPLGAEIVSVPAGDGFPLSGTLMRDSTSTRGVICLHGFHDNRTSFDPLLQELHRRGFNALALDLRGNHASLGRPDEQHEARERYLSRDPEWFRAMAEDVLAAKQYLIEAAGCDPTQIAVVGAGIGATIATLTAAEDEELAAFVLLSPGWRTLQIDVREEMQALSQRALFVTYLPAAPGQGESIEMLEQSLETTEDLTLHPVRSTYRHGHGTGAIRQVPELPAIIADWLSTRG